MACLGQSGPVISTQQSRLGASPDVDPTCRQLPSGPDLSGNAQKMMLTDLGSFYNSPSRP